MKHRTKLGVIGFMLCCSVGISYCKQKESKNKPVPDAQQSIIIPPYDHPSNEKTMLKIDTTKIVLAAQDGKFKYGLSKYVKITNTGTYHAKTIKIAFPTSDLNGLKIEKDDECLKFLAPNTSCMLTFNPSEELNETEFVVQGENTDPVKATVTVLDYGSKYQDGYVYALSPYVFGLNEKDLCDPQKHDKACSKIVNVVTRFKGSNGWTFETAKTTCAQKSTHQHKIWYLPDICEMGYSPSSQGPNCDSGIPNITSNFVNIAKAGDIISLGDYWSSTLTPFQTTAWYQHFDKSTNTYYQASERLTAKFNVLCTRAIVD